MNFACTVKFANKQQFKHSWTKHDDHVTLRQWCNKGTDKIKDDHWKVAIQEATAGDGCSPWSKTACEKTSDDCLHQHFEKGKKTLFRCGVKRSLEKEGYTTLKIGMRLAIRSGFNVYDEQEQLRRRAGFTDWHPILIQTESGASLGTTVSLVVLSLLALV